MIRQYLRSTWEGSIIFRGMINTGKYAGLLLLAFIGLPQSPLRAQDLSVYAELTIAPRICILNEKNELCDEKIVLEWRSDKKTSLCLFSSIGTTATKCWQEAMEGMLELDVSVDETVTFQLRDYHNELVVLASAEFKVMRDKKKYRRSRRNPWSFF